MQKATASEGATGCLAPGVRLQQTLSFRQSFPHGFGFLGHAYASSLLVLAARLVVVTVYAREHMFNLGPHDPEYLKCLKC